MLVACLAIGACAAPARDVSQISGHDGPDLKRVAAVVTRVRGLAEVQPTTISLVDDEQFVEALRDSPESPTSTSGPTPEQSRNDVYGAAHFLVDEARAIEQEETMGFYDPERRTIFLRRTAEGDTAKLPLSWVLAHEMGHALQHQHFPLLAGLTSGDAEARLSYRALLEGDATVTMLAYAAEASWLPLNRVLANALDEIERGKVNNLTRLGPPRALSLAPPLLRERFLFPYTAGTAFVAQLHRAGGFDLVNRAYQRPPVTTEQVLHPQKYLDGEGAAVFSELPVPEGAKAVARGHFGELHVLGLLEGCVGRTAAAEAAAGWGGDAFVISRAGDRMITMWSTVWDSERDAEEFEEAVSLCFTEHAADSVMRIGDRVSVLIGLSADQMAAMHDRLLKSPVSRGLARPAIAAVLRPFRRAPRVGPPYVANGAYFDPRIGITVPLPAGFSASTGKRSLFAEQHSRVGLLVVGLSEWLVSTASVRRLYSDLTDDVGHHLRGKRLDVVTNSRLETPLGGGLERTWKVHGSLLSVQMVVAPICAGAGAVIYLLMWADSATEEALHGALAHTTSTTAPRPVCSELNP